MRMIFAAVALVAIELSAAAATPFNVPKTPDGETREFKVRRVESQRKAGLKEWARPSEELAAYSVTTNWKNGPDGREMIVTRDDLRVGGHHCYWQFHFIVKDNKLVSTTFSDEIKTADGKLLRNESARVWVKDGPPPPDIVHMVALGEAARGMEFRQGATSDFLVWIPDGGQIPRGILTCVGVESVTVPAGTFKAWKVKMDFDLTKVLKRFKGLEFLVRLVVPKFTFWFADTPSKPLIKFSGQFAGAPIEYQELTKITGNGELK